MYWSRSLLKQNAKRVLAGSYWRMFLAILIVSLGIGAVSGSLSYFLLAPTVVASLTGFGGSAGAMAAVGLLSLAFLLAGAFAFYAFVQGPVMVGLYRYTMENRAGWPPMDTLFSAFRGKAPYLNVAKAMLLQYLEIFAFSLLLIIPGIVRGYQLVYVPYLLAENPYMSYRRAKQLSIAMTKGEKFEIFVLELSFIGWYLLAYLTCGVGIFFLSPYLYATYAELYAAARAKALDTGLATSQELAGFIAYPPRNG